MQAHIMLMMQSQLPYKGAMMKTITIRGIEPDLGKTIKAKAFMENLSVNLWVIKVLQQATGTGKKPIFRKYDDLDLIAGGWNRKEAETFLKDIKMFEEIDGEVWK
jgi:dethiobiotin synthetase